LVYQDDIFVDIFAQSEVIVVSHWESNVLSKTLVIVTGESTVSSSSMMISL
jgi:hypothetical protein